MKVQAREAEVAKVLYGYPSNTKISDGDNLTFSGGKIYRLGGGWWRVTGYYHSMADAETVIQALRCLKKVRGDVVGEAVFETIAKRGWVDTEK